MTEKKSWQKLTGEDYIKAVKAANSVFEQERFSLKNSVMQIQDLPFYKNYKLLKATETNAWPRYAINFLYSSNNIIKLDYSASTLSTANDAASLELNEKNMAAYLQFFFSSIRSDDGESFYFAESLSDIPIKENTDNNIIDEINKTVFPLNVTKQNNGDFKAVAFLVHQKNLYNAKIAITKKGEVNILEENIMLSDLPIQNKLLK